MVWEIPTCSIPVQNPIVCTPVCTRPPPWKMHLSITCHLCEPHYMAMAMISRHIRWQSLHTKPKHWTWHQGKAQVIWVCWVLVCQCHGVLLQLLLVKTTIPPAGHPVHFWLCHRCFGGFECHVCEAMFKRVFCVGRCLVGLTTFKKIAVPDTWSAKHQTVGGCQTQSGRHCHVGSQQWHARMGWESWHLYMNNAKHHQILSTTSNLHTSTPLPHGNALVA